MSNGNNASGNKKRMKITLEAEGYGTSVQEWQVEEELIRAYAIAYNAWIAKGGLELSKAVYDLLNDSGIETLETFAANTMLNAVK